jgi:hypothetical protein
MKILSRSTCLALALALLIVGFASPLPAQDKTVPQSPDGATAVPQPPAVKEAAPALAGSASLRIPAAAFRPRSNTVGFAYYSGGSMYATSTPTEWWSAPVYLPQGAVVNTVRMFYYDANATVNCNCIFDVFTFNDGILIQPLWSSSGSAGLGYADSPPINHTVDYTQYGYVLQWQPNAADTSIRLEGFQIFYTPPPGGRAAVIPLY